MYILTPVDRAVADSGRAPRRETAGEGRRGATWKLAAGLLLVAATAVVFPACSREREPGFEVAIGEEVRVGKRLIDALGCGSCHIVPGADGAKGMIGPSLQGVGARSYIAGTLVNTEENLTRWIMAPQEIHPDTAMPNQGPSEEQAHAIATYLGTLR